MIQRLRFRLLPALVTLVVMAGTSDAQRKLPSFTEEVLTPEFFTAVLKDEWFFLKDETDAFLKSIETRGEFETTAEFEQRVLSTKAQFVKKIGDHIKDRKLMRRVFSVILKARLNAYDADQGVYSVSCVEVAEVPYDIPTVVTFIPANPYVVLSDTIANNYRVSRMTVRLSPDLKWRVDRQTAIQAKGDEGNVVFRVRMMLDMRQNDITTQARFRLVAKDVSLYNMNTKQVYWKEVLQ